MSLLELSQRIGAGRQAVLAQVPVLRAGFGRAASHWKADGTRVTPADVAISEAIFASLGRSFPGDQFFSEELAHGDAPVPCTSEWAWILDPIDGTNNFALGVPVTAISLALLHRGEPVYGFIYDLGRRALLHGGPGQGLWEGGARIAPRSGATGPERIVALHAPIDARHLPLVNAILPRFKLRAFGSGALHLAYVSLGIIDACLDFTVRVWDIAAAAAFCRETGTEMEFLNGSPFPVGQFDLKMPAVRYLAGSPEACAEIRAAWQGAGWRP